jgi:hypothetical protein
VAARQDAREGAAGHHPQARLLLCALLPMHAGQSAGIVRTGLLLLCTY